MRFSVTSLAAVCALAVSVAPSTADAHDVPYGPAGCGLGHMLLGSDPGIMQILAMTTNGIFYNQSFGITTGTLGCDVGGSGASAAIFIEANREAVAKDVSRGGGETIATIAEIGECSSSEQVGHYLQGQFGTIFPDAGVSDHTVGETIVGLMTNHAGLNCKAFEPAS